MIYYVSAKGSDLSSGSFEHPFKTITKAARIAVAGDTVRVHGGVYREWVAPQYGGLNDGERIVYEAVEGETPVIKGSEIVDGWEKLESGIWKKSLPNSLFGDFNPFAEKVEGDWLCLPVDYDAHLGDVYLNGVSMYEAPNMEALKKAEKRTEGHHHGQTNEKIRYPEQTVYQWHAIVEPDETHIYCNFGEYDPNRETVEVSVRRSCFYPKRIGVNFITVRGFEMAHAATPWAPPTADQPGMIGPNWSYGWIIENNTLHDAKCSAVSLGKEMSTGHNFHSRTMRKSGYQSQQESVFLALKAGWSKEKIGSHIVRNNTIYNCGQAGIVGHLGCIFSRIEHNHIYNVNQKQEFWGHEVAGIKFHAAIDTVIENNNIHNCNLGIWLDWQAQGTRVTRNLFFDNARDLFIEVTHGPCLVDNNLLLSSYTVQEAAQGTAYVHNVIAGPAINYKVLDRATPYHFPHSTDVAGYAFVYGGDYRMINNLVIGNVKNDSQIYSGKINFAYMGELFDCYSLPEEYMPAIAEYGIRVDCNKYVKVPQPVWVEENAYSGYAKPFREEKSPILVDKMDARIEADGDKWTLVLNVPAEVANANVKEVTTERLGTPRITQERYESPDGSPVDLSYDIRKEKRDSQIIPGALSKLNIGVNRIVVWEQV